MTVIADVFPEIPAPEYLKYRVSEDPETENMANRSKHGSNLNESIFTEVINNFEGKFIGKSLF